MARVEPDLSDLRTRETEHLAINVAHHVIAIRQQHIGGPLDPPLVSLVAHVERGCDHDGYRMLHILLDVRAPDLHGLRVERETLAPGHLVYAGHDHREECRNT